MFNAGQSDVQLRTLGFYGQQEVAIKDRLFLSGAVRYDASSTFAPNERWQVFPKLSWWNLTTWLGRAAMLRSLNDVSVKSE